MATANTYLQVTELEFDQIRNNLKTYLSGQTQFEDYNFEGSGMAVMLDVLAYNTHYNAYYLNMLANEMFLDTAQQRDSVVSRAKELGYLPTSARGASANVNITFTGISASLNQITIPKNSTFTTTVDDITYTYVTPESYTIISENGSYTKDITIKEGDPVTHRFNVSTTNPIRYIIPNANVDTSSIAVRVQESSSDTTTNEFVRATNLTELSSVSKVFFLEETTDGKYEIVFGSGSLGQPVRNGNIVIVDYLVCNDEATNGATTFSIDSMNIGTSYTSVSLSTNSAAVGGRPVEGVDSIKFNAPRIFQTQNRAVIDNDYKRILLNENTDLQSVVAFGGELADPPVYGKVYIAVKPFGEQFATSNRKDQIRTSIVDRTPLGIDPVIIDADYTYIVPEVTTYYNKTTTSLSDSGVADLVRSTISTWASANLERFGNRLRYSRFVRALDNISNASILNNDATLKMQKRIVPNVDVAEKVEIRYNNPIRPGTVTSTQFTYNGFLCYLDDDESGNVNIYRFDSNKQKINVVAAAGTIDYTTGAIDIEAFAPTAYADIELKVTVTPDRLDIIPVREQILLMNAADATITVVPEYN